MTARNAAIDRELVKERDRARGIMRELALSEGMYANGSADDRAWREDTRFWEAQWRRSLWALARHRTAC